MFKFNSVSQQVFADSMAQLSHRTKDHDCIADGLVYVDKNDNVIGVALPESQERTVFYLATETAA